MRFSVFCLLLAVLLTGCQSTTVEEDPTEQYLPEGTISTINVAFAPEIHPFVYSISVWRFDKIPDMLGVGAAGAYIPFTKTILISDKASNKDRALVHEMLHVVFFKEEHPLPDLFESDLKRFLQDPKYSELAASVNKTIDGYKESWRFPRSFIDDEYYAYIGEYVYGGVKGGQYGLPEYMARHYRGVLNHLHFFDARHYDGKNRPCLHTMSAEFVFDGISRFVHAPAVQIRALARYGGAIRLEKVGGLEKFVIRSVGSAQPPQKGDYVIPPKSRPRKVRVCFKVPEIKQDVLGHVVLHSMEAWNEERYEFSIGAVTLSAVSNKFVVLEMSWNHFQRMIDLYVQGGLDIRLKSHLVIQLGRK